MHHRQSIHNSKNTVEVGSEEWATKEKTKVKTITFERKIRMQTWKREIAVEKLIHRSIQRTIIEALLNDWPKSHSNYVILAIKYIFFFYYSVRRDSCSLTLECVSWSRRLVGVVFGRPKEYLRMYADKRGLKCTAKSP